MKTIITCAVTGAITTKNQTPHLPITPEQIATASLEAAEAGAAIVHIHVRDPATGWPSMDVDLYRDTVDRIKKHNQSVLINLTTGPGGTYMPDPNDISKSLSYPKLHEAIDRVKHIQLIKPDLCSIDFNTMHQANNGIRINHRRITQEMVQLVQQAGTKPELEIFDSGDFYIAQEFVTSGIIKGTPFWQFAMGVKYGWGATADTLHYAHKLLPAESTWSAFGVGRTEMPILAQTMILGGHVRVGLEDNIYLKHGILAKTNAELVVMAKNIIELLGGELASPADAKKILCLN